uniref:Uncharacterized protein n=1 Tax=Physcomitrium patens TaxID=3218 RepID=A0A7I4D862_PHYPA
MIRETSFCAGGNCHGVMSSSSSLEYVTRLQNAERIAPNLLPIKASVIARNIRHEN